MGIFGGNLINFLGGVAEGAQKEIARQQASMDDLVKTASSVIINDRLATRKRRQERMSELGTQYEFLKNKGLDNRSIKVVMEQGLFEDVVNLSKKRNMTPEKLKSSINIVSGDDIPINKSSLLNYLTRDIVDADITNMSITGGVDTMGALGIRRPIGEQIKARVGAVTPTKTIDIDDKISGVTGGLSERAKVLLDKTSKMSPAAFRRLATSVLVDRQGGKVTFLLNSSGGYDMRTEGIQQADLLKAQKRASELTNQYSKIVFEEGGVQSLDGFKAMSSPEAVDYLLYPAGMVTKKYLPPANTNLNNIKKKRLVPDKSETPSFGTIPSLSSQDGTKTFNQEIKDLTSQGVGKIPANLKAHYIMSRALEIQQNDPSIPATSAYVQAQKEIRDYLNSLGM